MKTCVRKIAPSASLAITSKAKAMAAAGGAVYSFAAGEPDFDTPQPVKAAAAAALQAGQTKYAPVDGLPPLKAAIAAKLKTENDLCYDPSQIVVSNGAKHALANVFMAICDPGDEVILPAPYWLSYPEMIRLAGGVPAVVVCDEADRYKLTPAALEAALTDRTVAVVLNSPGNPTGAVYTPDELEALVRIAVTAGCYIVADEIYEKMVYDGARQVSAGSFSAAALDRTITVNGFSKTYAMTGWRLGYAAGPAEVIDAIAALQSHTTSGANTFAQYGAIAALEKGAQAAAEMVRAFDARRTYMYDRLAAMQGITCVKPRGAFYMFPSIAQIGLKSVPFAERLLKERGVAVIPGQPFGADDNIRLSYACGMETIEKGLDALDAFLKSLSM